ncbi:hypothetical protein Taro_006516 [Colocasia esculenta]|uniref:Uncharacterized protein n=1 Tax=Colocasia esculenta TaxID=4460 RepID=A0A843TRG0_COLES|nr:hypothetical protein [Colocasia esculenta]
MQGLVQAMQTQAHTQAALQSQLETQFRQKSVLASTWMDAHDMLASISIDANPNVAVHGCGRLAP